MSEFQPGEIVDFTGKGARIERVTTEGFDSATIRVAQVVVRDTDGRPYYITLPLEWQTIAVERRAPAAWPPQPGDLWKARNGFLHFAAAYSPDYDDVEDSRGINADGWRVVLLSQHSDETCTPGHQMHRPENVNQVHGPLALVYREGGEAP